MRTLKLTVAYDGSGYHGFQRQPRDLTVQQVLEEALSRITGEEVTVAGSGRTDSGVHGKGQVVSFATACPIPAANVKKAMNSILPPDIAVLKSEEAEDGFHARYSAKWKRYCYRIVLNDEYDPFIRNYAWQMQNTKLNVNLMNEAAAQLLGTHDFSFFRSSGSVQTSPVKTIYKAIWQETAPGNLLFTIEGDGFLYRMVRNIVWNLAEVGLGNKTVARFKEELNSAERHFRISPAPPQGLYLDYVGYSEYLPQKSDK